MPSWTAEVEEVRKINESVQRLVAGDLVVDVLARFLDVVATDRIQVNLEGSIGNKPKGGVCLHGVVYASANGQSVVSCGGLLCRVPVALPIHGTVFVSVSKSRRRRRE